MQDDGTTIALLAVDPPRKDAAKQEGPPLFLQLLPWIAIAFFLYLIVLRPQRREQQRREAFLNSLKKNDRVVTIGGIIGTVANISADGREVTVKVDDDTRIRFVRTAIQSVLKDDQDATTDSTRSPIAEKPAG